MGGTATIIAPEWSLTAKHCVRRIDDDDVDDVGFKTGDVDSDQGKETHAKEHGEADYAQLGNTLTVGGPANRTAQASSRGLSSAMSAAKSEGV